MLLKKQKKETSKSNSNTTDEGVSKPNSFSHRTLTDVCLPGDSVLMITTLLLACKHMQANTSTAEYTCNIVTFVFMLHQVTVGTCFNWGGEEGGRSFLHSLQMLQHRLNSLFGSKMWLMDLIYHCSWVTSGRVLKFSRTTDESYMNPQTALHQTTHFMKVISDAAGRCHHIYPQFLSGTDRDVHGPWLAPSNATTLQLHSKHT